MIRWCASHLLLSLPKQTWSLHASGLHRRIFPSWYGTDRISSLCSAASAQSAVADKNKTQSRDELEMNSVEPHRLHDMDKQRKEIWATQQLESLSDEDERRLKILKLEYSLFDSVGKQVPKHVTNCQWLELLQDFPSVSSRQKKFKFWFLNEVRVEKEKLRKLENLRNQEDKFARLEQLKASGNYDSTLHLKMMLFIREQTMNKHYYHNLCHAMLFGPDIVFDCGFEDHMRSAEIINLVKQMQAVYGMNKVQREPYHIHMCSVNQNGEFHRRMNKTLPLSPVPMTVTEKSYLDLFPKEKLVYLSPNSPKMLKSYNPDDVYIVGSIVDKSKEEPLTYAKAKREGIRSAKLPLDLYLDWGHGSKALTLVHMMGIMTTLRLTHDWHQAFKHIPQRNLKSSERYKRHHQA